MDSHLAITRGLGIPNAGASNPDAPEHSAREKLAIEYATAVHRDSNRVPNDVYERLRGAFTDAELVELTFLIGFINLLNWFNNALEVHYHREFDGIKVV